MTISIGVAVVEPTDERLPRGAVQLADQALYEAKVKGRNRVELMETEHYRKLVTGVFAKPSLGAEESAASPWPRPSAAYSILVHNTGMILSLVSLLSLLVWVYLFFAHGQFWRSQPELEPVAGPNAPSTGSRHHRSGPR